VIFENAKQKIERFNKVGVHYNIVADHVYVLRKTITDLFDTDYLPYLVAALISFDMERMMGKGSEKKYDINAGGFASRLHHKLGVINSTIKHLIHASLPDVDLQVEKENIAAAYNELSIGGKGGLNEMEGEFHVGATKILHFLNPELFLIVDSNASRAFRRSHKIKFRNTTQPGYSSDKYIRCMECAQSDISKFGEDKFRSLEPVTPIARIYDKLTFATGSGWF